MFHALENSKGLATWQWIQKPLLMWPEEIHQDYCEAVWETITWLMTLRIKKEEEKHTLPDSLKSAGMSLPSMPSDLELEKNKLVTCGSSSWQKVYHGPSVLVLTNLIKYIRRKDHFARLTRSSWFNWSAKMFFFPKINHAEISAAWVLLKRKISNVLKYTAEEKLSPFACSSMLLPSSCLISTEVNCQWDGSGRQTELEGLLSPPRYLCEDLTFSVSNLPLQLVPPDAPPTILQSVYK